MRNDTLTNFLLVLHVIKQHKCAYACVCICACMCACASVSVHVCVCV